MAVMLQIAPKKRDKVQFQDAIHQVTHSRIATIAICLNGKMLREVDFTVNHRFAMLQDKFLGVLLNDFQKFAKHYEFDNGRNLVTQIRIANGILAATMTQVVLASYKDSLGDELTLEYNVLV